MNEDTITPNPFGRPYLTPEEVFIAVADMEAVCNLSPMEVQTVRDGDKTYHRASTQILWTRMPHKYPRLFHFAAMGDTFEEAFEDLARMVDDWRVLQTINIPHLYRDGSQFFVRGKDAEGDES